MGRCGVLRRVDWEKGEEGTRRGQLSSCRQQTDPPPLRGRGTGVSLIGKNRGRTPSWGTAGVAAEPVRTYLPRGQLSPRSRASLAGLSRGCPGRRAGGGGSGRRAGPRDLCSSTPLGAQGQPGMRKVGAPGGGGV